MEMLSLESNLNLIRPNREKISLDQAYRKSLIVRDQIGISRVAEIGRFVSHGIYVCQATRPNLFLHYYTGHNTGAQGKGYTMKQAYVSAVMETAENFCAEPRTPWMIHGSYNELKKHHLVANPTQFIHPSFKSSIDPNEKLMWSYALHCKSGQEVLVPSEMCYVFHIPESYGDRTIFPASSAGLAAGFDDYSATLKALSEIIEQHYRGLSESLEVKIEGLKIEGEIQEIVQRMPDSFNRKYQTYFFSIQSLKKTCDLPYVMCFMGNESGLYRGWGLNIDPKKAIESAHIEAFQSWTTQVSSVREDIRPKFDASPRKSRLTPRQVKKMEALWPNEATLSYKEFASRYQYSKLQASDDLDLIYKILEINGFKDVYLVNLSRKSVGCSIVKAIVPQLCLSLDVHPTPDQLPTIEADTINRWKFNILKSKKGVRK